MNVIGKIVNSAGFETRRLRAAGFVRRLVVKECGRLGARGRKVAECYDTEVLAAAACGGKPSTRDDADTREQPRMRWPYFRISDRILVPSADRAMPR